jgi:hypothetical protein
MKLGVIIYKLVDKLPKKELYFLSDQILVIARGSKSELETQLLLCVEVGYLKEDEILEAMNLLTELSKMLNALISKLRNS